MYKSWLQIQSQLIMVQVRYMQNLAISWGVASSRNPISFYYIRSSIAFYVLQNSVSDTVGLRALTVLFFNTLLNLFLGKQDSSSNDCKTFDHTMSHESKMVSIWCSELHICNLCRYLTDIVFLNIWCKTLTDLYS